MGARLVAAALQPVWASLTASSRVVLMAMCLTALDSKGRDDTTTRLYFGGQELLMLYLHGECEPGSKQWQKAKKAVSRAWGELEEAGAVVCERRAGARGKAVYRILVEEPLLPLTEPVENPVDNPVDLLGTEVQAVSSGGHQCPPIGGHQCLPEGDTSVYLRWTPVSTLKRGTTEEQQRSDMEEPSQVGGELTSAGAPATRSATGRVVAGPWPGTSTGGQ